jgi:hypothetical protein
MATAPVANLNLSIDELASELDRTGFVCLEDVVSPDWLRDARADVESSLSRYGENDFCVINPGKENGSPAQRFVSDPVVCATFERLVSARYPRVVAEGEEIDSALRVLAGPERAASSFVFHYDASVVTMLVPIFIPDVGPGRSGEFVIFPNMRPVRRSSLMNIADKIAVQNRLYRWRMVRKFSNAPEKYSVVLKPGNVYFLWGYRCYHGNAPCATDTVRATLLLHYGDPHKGSPLINTAKAVKRWLAPSTETTEAAVMRF